MVDAVMSKIPAESNDKTRSMSARELISLITRRDRLICPDTTLLHEIDGWDSLKGVRLVLRLEELTGRELLESEIEGLRSVGDIDRVLGLIR
jgi:acyl carrier protein